MKTKRGHSSPYFVCSSITRLEGWTIKNAIFSIEKIALFADRVRGLRKFFQFNLKENFVHFNFMASFEPRISS